MCKTFLKSHRLNVQDLIAATFSFFSDSRYEWSGIKFPCKLCGSSADIKINFIIEYILSFRSQIRCKTTGCHSSSLILQSVDIQICIECTVYKTSALCKNCAIFCNQIMSSIDNILCGFSLTCSRIDVAAEESCRLCTYQTSAVGILTDNLIACRQIYDQVCPMIGVCHTWRIQNPEIFAYFCCDPELWHIRTGKQYVG